MSKQTDFIKLIAPACMKGQREGGILSSLTMAQVILESGWGKSVIGNNVLGIKAPKGWTGKTQTVDTKEFIGGKWVVVKATFKDYDSLEDCIQDHTSLFTRLDRYANLRGETDWERACYLVWKDGYATDPNYPELLKDIIRQWKLYEYDTKAVQVIHAESSVNPRFAKARERLMKLGITDGSNPQGNITREQVWYMIDKALGLDK